MDELLEIKENKELITPKVYPMVEELTFRAIITSENEGYSLLKAVQRLVNELGTPVIIEVVDIIEKKPSLMSKAKSYLPLLRYL